MEKDNLKYQLLVKNNFKVPKKNSKNDLGTFKEEKPLNGNNLSPNELKNTEQKINIIKILLIH